MIVEKPDNKYGDARMVILRITIVLGLITVISGLLAFFTGYEFFALVLRIVGPFAVLGVFVGLWKAFTSDGSEK